MLKSSWHGEGPRRRYVQLTYRASPRHSGAFTEKSEQAYLTLQITSRQQRVLSTGSNDPLQSQQQCQYGHGNYGVQPRETLPASLWLPRPARQHAPGSKLPNTLLSETRCFSNVDP